MRIAFASGKGGTGKTMLATSVARQLALREGIQPVYVDADVEEPDGHLFLEPVIEREHTFTVPVPTEVEDRCLGCRQCQAACAYHAIIVAGTSVMVFPELCHSCGLCTTLCPEEALEEVPRRIGLLQSGHSGGLRFVAGLLDVGEARSTPLVQASVAIARGEPVIIDCPPGTSCPVMAAVEGADLVVLVTEPTPFGLHDLDLAARMCRQLGLRVAAVVNRSDLGDRRVFDYLEEAAIPLLATIPFERQIATAYAQGRVAVEASESVRTAVDGILAHLQQLSEEAA